MDSLSIQSVAANKRGDATSIKKTYDLLVTNIDI